MPSILPTRSWTSEDLLWAKSFLQDRIPYSLYFQCQLDAMGEASDRRGLYIGKDRRGLILAIAFDGADVFTTVGDLTEDELKLTASSDRVSELHVDVSHLDKLLSICGARVQKVDDLLYYRLDYAAPLTCDARCRLLTDADYMQAKAFYDEFYAETVFSRWMLNLPFCGLFDNGTLIAAGGAIIWSKEIQMCNIGNFLTHPDYRGRGYARAVTRHLLALLNGEGMQTFTLGTNELNRAAQRVYESLGFRLVERRKQIDLRKASGFPA